MKIRSSAPMERGSRTRSRQNDKTPIFGVAANGGAPEQLCGDCGEVEQWTPSGHEILFVTADDPSGVGLLKVGTSPNRGWLRHPGYGVFNARLSPDGQWVSFNGRPNSRASARVFIAKVQDSVVSGEKEWTVVTDDGDAPSWSPQGKSSVLLVESGRLTLPVGAASRSDDKTADRLAAEYPTLP